MNTLGTWKSTPKKTRSSSLPWLWPKAIPLSYCLNSIGKLLHNWAPRYKKTSLQIISARLEKNLFVLTVKSWGVHIDENLTWECHINELSKKIASGISTIKRIRYLVPYKTLLSVYNLLVQPHLDYCSSVWGSCSKTLSQKLQKLQNQAARVIIFSNYDCNTDELLRMVNWVKLDRQRLVNKSIMMYKIVNNMFTLCLPFRYFDLWAKR